jgi:hypothetical protein
LEELIDLIWVYSNTGVAYRKANAVRAIVSLTGYVQPDLAGLRKLAGVAEQVENNLAYPQWVCTGCAYISGTPDL